MKSSSGQHYVGLDHVRAFAAFMVFSWHFMHTPNGFPVSLAGAPAIFPLAIFDEGHTGVALFMTLSGYLFAKLMDGKAISYAPFFWNRFIRLFPLFFVVLVIVGIRSVAAGQSVEAYLAMLGWGLIRPTLPNGGWSLTVEMHFYAVLPLLLALCRRNIGYLALVLAACILMRIALFHEQGRIQFLAYWTIIGHIDQFILGIIGFNCRSWLRGRTMLAVAIFLGFTAFWWGFDMLGGFYNVGGKLPDEMPWIFIPTIEGAAFAALIAYYDASFTFEDRGFSGFVALIGKYSYSIYLLHFFVVFELSAYIHAHILSLDNFYVALIVSLFAFLLMLPLGHLSFKCIEEPFLSYRRPYTRARHEDRAAPAMISRRG